MSQNGKPGCLGQVMQWFGFARRKRRQMEPPPQPTSRLRELFVQQTSLAPADASGTTTLPAESVELPYEINRRFVSNAERSFFHVLRNAMGDSAVICSKVSLGDLFHVTSRDLSEQTTYRNKIDRKHVDFLLCDPGTLRPLLGIELDDSSHQRWDRQGRDLFVEEVFAAANLPLLRVPVRRSYYVRELAIVVRQAAGMTAPDLVGEPPAEVSPPSVAAKAAPAPPPCPTCGKEMVLRTAARPGPNMGNQFWGCPDFPRCRGVRQLETGMQ